ncbi:MAG: glycosyltransferase family 2 protein [Gammaproteobacteria bacterium]|nr:glycosyltransferase family 2 protein [Gammaproteobacteria bacterium]
MFSSPKVAVLLPTYNGALFLGRQLQSLLDQSMQDFVIITRDDGSTDETRSVVQSYLEKTPHRFHRIEDDKGNLGASHNFSLLMQYVLDHGRPLGLQNCYLMLCDQDDIWESNKIEVELDAISALEQQHPNSPLLVHSDLTVIREDESLIAESFLSYQGLDAANKALRNITFSNTVTGCTALFNQQLVRKALPVPAEAMMHDWWLAMVAAAFGHIQFIPRSLVRYRQHGQNTLGASEFIPRNVFSRTTIKQLFRTNPEPLLKAVASQSEAFSARYGKELSLPDRRRLTLAGWLRTDSFFVQRILFRLLKL